jgi:hypothetical protein
MVTTLDVLARQMAEAYDELGQTLLGVSDAEIALGASVRERPIESAVHYGRCVVVGRLR